MIHFWELLLDGCAEETPAEAAARASGSASLARRHG